MKCTVHEAHPSIDRRLTPSSMAGSTFAVTLTEGAEDAMLASPRLDLPLDHPVLRAAALTGHAIVP